MNSPELYNFLYSQNKVFTITEDFIQHRNEMKDKFGDWDGERTPIKKLMDSDCLIIEYMLLKDGVVDKPENIQHDFILKNFKVDIKVIQKWFNISSRNFNRFYTNTINGDLTHFAIYRFVTKHDKPFEVGDVCEVELIEVNDSRSVLKAASPSTFEGYYYNATK